MRVGLSKKSTVSPRDQLLEKCRKDFKGFAARFLKVRNKKGELVPFVLNRTQVRFFDFCMELHERGLPVRVAIPKARQLGLSTVCQAILIWRAVCFEKSSITIAHLEEPSAELFGKIETFYENMPEWLRPARDSSRRGKKLLLTNGALMYTDHARNKGAGRGQTFQGGHFSEPAFWDDLRTVLTAVMQCIPNEPDTWVFLESTANGMNDWYALCQNSVVGEHHRDFNGWHMFFVPWTEGEEYQRERRASDRDLSKAERRLMREHGLSEAQVLWRRDKIREIGEDHLRQEYPLSLRESFLASGRPYFEDLIIAHRKTQAAPLRMGEFAKDPRSKKVRFVDTSAGAVWLWEMPQKDATYVISADVASGAALDNSAIHVLKLGDVYDVVGTFRGKIDPDQLAVLLRRLGLAYSTGGRPALLAPERNSGYGERCVEHLSDDLRYTNLFLRRRLDTADYRQSRDYGWHTGTNTRGAALERLKQALRDGDIRVRCERTLDELETMAYVPQSNGGEKVEAPRGAHDDMVMSLAIGVSVADQAPRVRPGMFRGRDEAPVVSSVTGY